MKYLLLLLTIAVGEAYGCDRVNLAMRVTHFSGKSYNENGPITGCETKNYAFRYMRNSHDNDAYSVTRKLVLASFINIHVGAELGVTTGYRDKLVNVGGVSPWALLTARFPVTSHITATGVFFGAGAGVVLNLEL